MAIVDTGLIQDWIRAQDRFDGAERRLRAAEPTRNRELIAYLQQDRDDAQVQVNAALRALNAAAG